MADMTRKISLGACDVASLESDDDFRRAAQRLVPDALRQAGQFAGEAAWAAIEKGFRGSILKIDTNEKSKIIREAATNYERDPQSRREIEGVIIARLKEMKAEENK